MRSYDGSEYLFFLHRSANYVQISLLTETYKRVYLFMYTVYMYVLNVCKIDLCTAEYINYQQQCKARMGCFA